MFGHHVPNSYIIESIRNPGGCYIYRNGRHDTNISDIAAMITKIPPSQKTGILREFPVHFYIYAM